MIQNDDQMSFILFIIIYICIYLVFLFACNCGIFINLFLILLDCRYDKLNIYVMQMHYIFSNNLVHKLDTYLIRSFFFLLSDDNRKLSDCAQNIFCIS